MSLSLKPDPMTAACVTFPKCLGEMWKRSISWEICLYLQTEQNVFGFSESLKAED